MAARMTAEDASISRTGGDGKGGGKDGLRQRKGKGGAEGTASGGTAEQGGNALQSSNKKGFSFLQLVIVAILMFLAGKMFK